MMGMAPAVQPVSQAAMLAASADALIASGFTGTDEEIEWLRARVAATQLAGAESGAPSVS